jgi:2'-5' RNA ligase
LGELIAALRALPWMSWERHDAENLHPHMTVAEKCGARFGEVWEFVKTRERRFSTALDNITIFAEEGERDGVPLCSVHRSFGLG